MQTTGLNPGGRQKMLPGKERSPVPGSQGQGTPVGPSWRWDHLPMRIWNSESTSETSVAANMFVLLELKR